MSGKFFFQPFLFLLLAGPVVAQVPPPANDVPRAMISKAVKIGADKGILFAVRIFASPSKPLALYHPPVSGDSSPGQQGGNPPRPFSLNGSSLRDLYSDKVYPNFPTLPNRPFVGPMEVTSEIQPGGWIQLGVAFPPIPAPPLDNRGEKQPYLLLFEIPELKISTKIKIDPETFKILGEVK